MGAFQPVQFEGAGSIPVGSTAFPLWRAVGVPLGRYGPSNVDFYVLAGHTDFDWTG